MPVGTNRKRATDSCLFLFRTLLCPVFTGSFFVRRARLFCKPLFASLLFLLVIKHAIFKQELWVGSLVRNNGTVGHPKIMKFRDHSFIFVESSA